MSYVNEYIYVYIFIFTHTHTHTHGLPRFFPCVCGLPRWHLDGTVVKNPSANAGDTRDAGLIPGLGRSPEEGDGYSH